MYVYYIRFIEYVIMMFFIKIGSIIQVHMTILSQKEMVQIGFMEDMLLLMNLMKNVSGCLEMNGR